MDDNSVPGHLEVNGVSHETIMAALLKSSHKTEEWRKSFERRMHHVETVQATMLKELQSNTIETVAARSVITEVRDAMTTARTIRKAVVWFAGFATSLAVLWEVYTRANPK